MFKYLFKQIKLEMELIKKKIRPYLEITFGVIVLSCAFYFFFSPLDLVIGGVTGLSLIFGEFIDEALFILIGNIVCLLIGAIFLGKKFFVNTIYGTLLMPVVIFVLEFTADKYFIINQFETKLSQMLVTVTLGSFLVALGLGLCFRNNATTGGIDVIQKIISNKFKIPYSLSVYFTDGIIVIIGLFTFGLEKTFYGVIAILLMGYVVDKISVGGKSTRTVYIITKKPDDIKNVIYEKLNRGVTYNQVQGGYSKEDYTMVICTLPKIQSYHLKELIKEIDEHAFTYVTETHEVIGDGFSEN